MAQVAHFTATSQNKPSIFEVIAQDSLNETLYPALQKVALFLANNFPKKFQWLCNYYDETFLGINVLLQYYYLWKHDASFSENFYGLKRVTLNSTKPLSETQRQLSLLMLTVLPYFKRKLQEKITIYKVQKAEGTLRDNLQDDLKKVLIHLHSISHFSWGTWTVINYLRYMSRETNAQLPILEIINLQFVYSGEIETIGLSNFAKNSVRAALEIAAFFIQFLQVWNAEKPNYNLTALPIVGAPNRHEKAKQFLRKCPICLQICRIPTVLPVSGFVFCFPCILRYLRENQKCPVTNLPAKPMDIIRLYDS